MRSLPLILICAAATAADGPGFVNTARTVGAELARWDMGGRAGAAEAGRTTIMGWQRGWLIADSRAVIDGGGFQVWDISRLPTVSKVAERNLNRPFHAYFQVGDLYTNNGAQWWDLSAIPTIAAASTTGWTMKASTQNRDWMVPPYQYLGQNGYSTNTDRKSVV